MRIFYFIVIIKSILVINQKIFFSALKTLEEMEKNKSWVKISSLGKKVKSFWLNSAKKNNLKISITGLNAIPSFSIKSNKWINYKSYITYEMLKNNILASNYIFLSICQNNKVLKKYFKVLNKIFKNISKFENNLELEKLKMIPLCHTGFKRLN